MPALKNTGEDVLSIGQKQEVWADKDRVLQKERYPMGVGEHVETSWMT